MKENSTVYKQATFVTELENDNDELWKYVTPKGPFGSPSGVAIARLSTSGVEWLSYNVSTTGTYFDDIFNISGQPAKVEKYGDYYSYEHCPRAKLFKRDHDNLTDMDSIMTYMRYNDYKNDPLSRCNCTPPYNPAYAIAARYDLLCPHGKYGLPGMYRRGMGGIDVKVTNRELSSSLEYVAVSGPTWANVPTFQWSTSGLPDSHVGHPDRWQFGPVHHKWQPARESPSKAPLYN
ncbi:hypothetical protein HPB49_018362 [Dermacentor silvarum]|uniref:Uncharacterized protein n=1 Tax=Dermacentor silvarum TaxID=543639 RepID=A0ACB8CGK2_DERSI|nr:hypothetical protein HPB49_018362 [Dermacentor silvarum]